jgi:hypothetical protein
MKASEKYRIVFGSLSHLSTSVPWTTGLSNMVEFLVWNTNNILGVPKKQYWEQIVRWTKSDEMNGLSIEEIGKKIDKKLQKQLIETEQLDRYSRKSTGICSAREALRRVKYFSEDYLNKEFDIFLSLSHDSYLDKFYKQYIDFKLNNTWTTHGNSGLFEYSTELNAMSMDNLAYNVDSNILVANELKLNGKKNPDQILKYCLMYNYLENKRFINLKASFLLLFIGGSEIQYDLKTEVEKEIVYCRKKGRDDLLTDDILKRAKSICLKSITWHDMTEFNIDYLSSLGEEQQVEKKLLLGFNMSINEKSFMQS